MRGAPRGLAAPRVTRGGAGGANTVAHARGSPRESASAARKRVAAERARRAAASKHASTAARDNKEESACALQCRTAAVEVDKVLRDIGKIHLCHAEQQVLPGDLGARSMLDLGVMQNVMHYRAIYGAPTATSSKFAECQQLVREIQSSRVALLQASEELHRLARTIPRDAVDEEVVSSTVGELRRRAQAGGKSGKAATSRLIELARNGRPRGAVSEVVVSDASLDADATSATALFGGLSWVEPLVRIWREHAGDGPALETEVSTGGAQAATGGAGAAGPPKVDSTKSSPGLQLRPTKAEFLAFISELLHENADGLVAPQFERVVLPCLSYVAPGLGRAVFEAASDGRGLRKAERNAVVQAIAAAMASKTGDDFRMSGPPVMPEPRHVNAKASGSCLGLTP